MNHKLTILGVAAMLALIGSSATAGTYYVDVAGEAGSTGSEFAPMRTVGGGTLQLKQAGDTLVIRRGLYIGTVELSGLRGQRNNPIRIRGERMAIPPEEANLPNVSPSKYAPLLKADRLKDNVLVIRDCSYVEIEGLILTGASKAGVLIENSDHVTLRNCDIVDNAGTQVQAKGGHHISLDNCEISGSLTEHGCQFWMTDQPLVRNCRIHHNAASAVHFNGDKKTGGDGLIDQAVVENCVIYANGRLKPGGILPRDDKGREIRPVSLRYGSAAIAGDGLERGVIRNNAIHHNHVGGIVLYRDEAARAGQNTMIVNNTIYLSADQRDAFGIFIALMAQGTQIYNNVIVTAQGPVIKIDKGATREMRGDHNVFFRLDNKDPFLREKEAMPLARWQDLYRLDRNSILFNPPFVDADNSDLTLCDLQLKPESRLGGRCPFNWQAQADLLGRWRPKDRVTPGCFELSAVQTNPHQQPQPDPRRHGGPPHRNDQKQPPAPTPEDPPIKPGPVILPPLDL